MVGLAHEVVAFQSEHADSVLPSFDGAPATQFVLRVSADAETPWTQMSILMGTTVIQAVQSFYLAKRSRQYFSVCRKTTIGLVVQSATSTVG